MTCGSAGVVGRFSRARTGTHFRRVKLMGEPQGEQKLDPATGQMEAPLASGRVPVPTQAQGSNRLGLGEQENCPESQRTDAQVATVVPAPPPAQYDVQGDLRLKMEDPTHALISTFGMQSQGQGSGISPTPPPPATLGAPPLLQQGTPVLVTRLSATKGSKGPLVCQIQGCNRDLSQEKKYYKRYRVCMEHLKMAAIYVDGELQRFCQQCGRFHDLSKFDGEKRNCRERLSQHNRRRRKSKRAAMGGNAGSDGSWDDANPSSPRMVKVPRGKRTGRRQTPVASFGVQRRFGGSIWDCGPGQGESGDDGMEEDREAQGISYEGVLMGHPTSSGLGTVDGIPVTPGFRRPPIQGSEPGMLPDAAVTSMAMMGVHHPGHQLSQGMATMPAVPMLLIPAASAAEIVQQLKGSAVALIPTSGGVQSVMTMPVQNPETPPPLLPYQGLGAVPGSVPHQAPLPGVHAGQIPLAGYSQGIPMAMAQVPGAEMPMVVGPPPGPLLSQPQGFPVQGVGVVQDPNVVEGGGSVSLPSIPMAINPVVAGVAAPLSTGENGTTVPTTLSIAPPSIVVTPPAPNDTASGSIPASTPPTMTQNEEPEAPVASTDPAAASQQLPVSDSNPTFTQLPPLPPPPGTSSIDPETTGSIAVQEPSAPPVVISTDVTQIVGQPPAPGVAMGVASSAVQEALMDPAKLIQLQRLMTQGQMGQPVAMPPFGGQPPPSTAVSSPEIKPTFLPVSAGVGGVAAPHQIQPGTQPQFALDQNGKLVAIYPVESANVVVTCASTATEGS